MKNDVNFGQLLGGYRVRCGWSQEELAKRASVSRSAIVLWERHERGRQANTHPQSRGVVLRLAEELLLSKEERKRFVEAAGMSVEHWPTEYWSVPYLRNPLFLGRDDLLQSLRNKLVPGRKATALTQSINGLGGIGKTQVALEYAHRYGEHYEAVFWVTADSLEVATANVLRLATEVLGLPEQQEAAQQIARVKMWLQKRQNWLLILDNVEDPQQILSTFTPTKHQGSVLLTTRQRNGGPRVQSEVLQVFPEQDALLFLLRRSGSLDEEAPVTEATTEEFFLARSLCHLLDRLPLALDQAGAYIVETGCTLQSYLDLYTTYRRALLDRRDANDQPQRRSQKSDHPASLLTTFQLAWEQIQQRDSLAGKALQCCAFLAPPLIPEALIRAGLTLSQGEEAVTDLPMNDALGLLHRYSLVERGDQQTLTLHRLVQEVLQDILSEVERERWMERSVQIVNAFFPSGKYGTWEACEFLLPHALLCVKWISVLRQKRLEGVQLLSVAGRYLSERGRYVEAEPLCQQALSIGEELLGLSHPEIAVSLNNLASLYETLGRYQDAELLYKRALAILEGQRGPSCLETAASLNNLASLYETLGRYQDAEPLHKRALSIREDLLGLSHLETAGSLNNLASLYETLGRYQDAELLYKRALAISEESNNSSHPQTATSLNNLALLYMKQKRYGDAEPLYKKSLSILEELLGTFHPRTATILNNLAELYRIQGRYRDAEPLYKQALAISEALLVSSHPETAVSLNNLALLYVSMGRYQDAESLYKQALSIFEEQLGPAHPDATNTLANLAELRRLQNCHEEAELLYKSAIMLSWGFLGTEHPHSRQLVRGCLMLLWDKYPNDHKNVLSQLLEQLEQYRHISGESL
jgi:tetratricopeptide (TPR) repeat protein/DNA-binding XRE family transcriptional regulator